MPKTTYKVLDSDCIKLNPYNPTGRMEKHLALRRDLQVRGVRSPLQLSKDYFILDGHNRYKQGLELGITEFPCVINHDLRKTDMGLFNSSTKSFKGRDWLSIYVKSRGKVPHMKATTRKWCERLLEMFDGDWEAIESEICKDGRGKGVEVAKMADRCFNWMSTQGVGTVIPTHREIITWLIRHRMTAGLRYLMGSSPGRAGAKRLHRAVTTNKKLTFRKTNDKVLQP